MKRDLDALTGRRFDLLVIGGGINGAGIARDAARRGLSVALLEKHDFGDGTSSRSSRLIHGGLRYLESMRLGLVRESLKERTLLLRIAPHVVRPLEFLLPIYRGARRNRVVTRIGLTLYDTLAGRSPLPRHRMIPVSELLAREPHIEPNGLVGGAIFHDASVDDRRLVLLNVIDAARNGAVVANHVEVTGIEPGSRVRAFDSIERKDFEVEAQNVVNAAGPAADRVRSLSGIRKDPSLRLSRGTHLAFPPTRRGHAVLMSSHLDGRVVFLIPDGEVTLVGTTEAEMDEPVDDPQASDAEIAYLLETVSAHFPEERFTRDRILYTTCGIRPLYRNGTGEAGKLSREAKIDAVSFGVGRFLSVYGGKITTYRRLAEKVVDRLTTRPCDTGQPLPGGDPVEPEGVGEAGFSPHLVRRYGSDWRIVVGHARENPDLLLPCIPDRLEIGAEVVHAARCEMVVRLSDLLLGRFEIGRAPDQGRGCAEAASRVLAAELGWEEARRQDECRRFLDLLERRHRLP